MAIDGLEKLETWQKSCEYANLIYRMVIPLLPIDEKYNLVSQLKRAAVSIPANIAEGYGRYYYQSNIQFCYIARGSVEETISHLILAFDQGYITEPIYSQIKEKGILLKQLINGYVAYLKKAKQGENDPGSPKMIKDQLLEYQTTELSEDSFITNHESQLTSKE